MASCKRDAFIERLGRAFPQFTVPGPSLLMLGDAAEFMQGTDTYILTNITGLCTSAAKSTHGWYLLPKGPLGLKAFRLLLDRYIRSEEPDLKVWLGSILASEACADWFDGSLLVRNLENVEITKLTLETFATKKQGAMAALKLCVSLLKAAQFVTAPNPATVDVIRAIYARVSTDATVARMTLEYLKVKRAGSNRKLELSRCPSYLPVVSFSRSESERFKLRFHSVDWIGFDLDFTLVEFYQSKRLDLMWQCVRTALEESNGTLNKHDDENPRVEAALKQAIRLPAHNLFVKCVVIDVLQGNFFKLDQNGRVSSTSVFHGSGRMDPSLAQDVYANLVLDWRGGEGEQDEEEADGKQEKMDKEKNYIFVHTDFEMPLALAFASCIDCADAFAPYPPAGDNAAATAYRLILDRLSRAFVLAQSPYFKQGIRAVYEDKREIAKLVRDQSTTTRQWLERLRSKAGKKLFLLSDGKSEHVQLMMDSSYGPEWEKLFDLIIVDAKKQTFFHQEKTSSTPSPYQGQGRICKGGNLKQFADFTLAERVLYFGDHPVKDVVLPNKHGMWQSVAVVADLETDPFAEMEETSTLAWLRGKLQSSSSTPLADRGARMGSSFMCEDGVPTILAKYLETHAVLTVPSIRFCANENMFI